MVVSVTSDASVVPASSVSVLLTVLTVSSASVTFGPDDGGALLSVTGSSFLPPPVALYCVWDRAASILATASPLLWSSPATYLNSTALSCTVAPHAPANVTLEVLADAQVSSTALWFDYTPQLRLLQLSPSWAVVIDVEDMAVEFDSSLAALLAVAPAVALSCMFDTAQATPLSVVNATYGTCALPVMVATQPHTAQVTVVDSTGMYASNPLPFVFVAESTVAAFYPTMGTVAGGTVIAVTGGSFSSSPAPLCVFNQSYATSIAAVVASSAALTCVTPPSTAGPVSVQLCITATACATLPGAFVYVPTPTIGNVSTPVYVGSAIVVPGSAFVASSASLSCLFAGATVASAIFDDPSQVTCSLPLLPSVLTNTTVTLAVSNDGVDWSNSVSFLYLIVPLVSVCTVTSLSPLSGPPYGGTVLTVTGAGFVASASLSCMVGLTTVPAAYVNSTAVTCITPPYSAGAVQVSASNDGAHFSSVTLTFTYAALPVVTAATADYTGGQLVVTVQGSGFTPSSLCAFVGNASQWYPFFASAELPQLPAVVYSPPLAVNASQLSCASPPPSAFLSALTGLTGNYSSVAALSSLVGTVVSVAVVTEVGGPVTSAAPIPYPELTTPTVSGVSTRPMTDASPYFAVDVWGGNFVDSAALACRYLVTATPSAEYQRMVALYLAPTHIICRADAATAIVPPTLSSAVEVTVDGQLWVAGGPVTWVSPPAVTALSPPALTAGATFALYLTGTAPFAGWGSGATPVCEVAGQLLSGAWVNSSTAVCGLRPADYAASLLPLPVRLSLDGWAWSAPLYLQPFLPATVASVFPPSGPVAGGTVVTVTGTGFTNATQCSFHFEATSAVPAPLDAAAAAVIMQSSTSLLCTTPSAAALAPARVRVQVYNGALQAGGWQPLSAVFFQYLAPVSVSGWAPLYAAVGSTAVVTVTGAGFVPLSSLACGFSAVGVGGQSWTAAAVPVNASQLLCPLSQAGNATQYTAQVTVDGVAFTALAPGVFTFIPAPVMTEVAPVVVDAGLQTPVTVTGVGLVSTTPPLASFCVFDGWVVVPATVASATSVSCMAPNAAALPGRAWRVGVEVQVGATVRSSSGLYVQYAQSPVIRSIAPALGPTTGGTVVTIQGLHFVPRSAPASLALSLSSSSATSYFPVIPSSATVCTFTMPAAVAGNVSVALSINAGDVSATPALFSYYTPPTLSGLSPSAVPFYGGTLVTVLGAAFPSAAPACQFGSSVLPPSVTVPAVRVDMGRVICLTPLLTAGVWPVTVSWGGAVWATNALNLTATIANTVSSAASPSGNLTLSAYQWLALTFSSAAAPAGSMVCQFEGQVTTVASLGGGYGCPVPALPYADPTPVVVQVLDDTAAVVYTTALTYQAFVHVSGVTPVAALTSGGAQVSMRGQRLSQQGLQCVWTDGVVQIQASVQLTDPSHGVCTAPPWPAVATVTLQVTTAQPSPTFPYPTPASVVTAAATVLWVGAFTYYAGFTVAALTPAVVSADYTGVVTVMGVGFDATAPLYCAFGGVATTAAMVLSSTALTCAVPPLTSVPAATASGGLVPVVGNVSVMVMLGADVATRDRSTALSLLWTSPPSITALAPAVALAYSGFNVTLVGGAFLASLPYTCVVQDAAATTTLVRVAAVVVNATTVNCWVTSLPASAYQLQLLSASTQAVPYLVSATLQALALVVLPALTVTSVVPVLVSAAGGTPLTIAGIGLTLPCQCRFGGTVVVTGSSQGGALRCLTPSAVSVGGGLRMIVEVACSPFPTVWVNPQVPLTFYTPPTVSSMFPATGVTSMDSSLYISGTSFLPVTTLGCGFTQGNVSVQLPAVYLSPTLLLCQPLSSLPFTQLTALGTSGFTGLGAGSVTVSVTVNGVDYSSMAASLPLFAVPPLLPSAGPLLLAVTPAQASTAGGTLVTLTGAHFDLLTFPATCQWSTSALTPALVLNATALTCATPVGTATGAATLCLSYTAGFDTVAAVASGPTLPFLFLPAPVVTRVHPTLGPSSGGTVATVVGQSFLPSITCALNGVTGLAQWLSPTQALCTTPAVTAGAGVLRVSNTGAFDPATNRSLDWAAFTLYPLPQVVGLSPNSGPASGNTTVTVTVAPPLSAPSAALHCRFGAVVSPLPARWLNSSAVACMVDGQAPGVVAVDVTANGLDWSTSAVTSPQLNFTLVATSPPALTSLAPAFGPASGGTVVTIAGVGLTPDPVLAGGVRCLWGGLGSTPAAAVSAAQVTCATPQGAANVTVAVSLQLTPVGWAQAVTAGGLWFTFASPQLSVVTPALVSTPGATAVTVTGAGFATLAPPVACVFNQWTAAAATVVSDAVVTCVAPAFGGLGLAAVYPALCPLAVSWAGGVITGDAALTLSYAPVPAVTALDPTAGVATRLTVTGSGFLPTPGSVCGVGATILPAHYSSSTVVYCALPRMPPAVVAVRVSLNGVDWSNALNYTAEFDADVLGATALLSPLTGGVVVTLTGSHFTPSAQLACLFTPPGVVVAALWLSSTVVQCATPSVAMAGQAAVQVTVDGRNWTDAKEASVLYAEAAVITSLTPTSTYAGLAATLTIAGVHFMASPSPVCYVGGVAVATTLAPGGALLCAVPGLQAGAVLVTVGPNNYSAASQATWTVLPTPVLTTVSPPRVSQALAPTTALVTGWNFSAINAVDLLCAFASSALLPLYPLLTPLVYLNPAAVTCALPASLVPASVNLSLVLSSSPAVQVSANRLAFTFDPDYSVTGYVPQEGPYTVTTVVTITGAGFINSPLTQCRLGLTLTQPAVYLSPTTLLCSMPPRWTVPTLDASMQVQLLLTQNGQDYIGLLTPFRYLLPGDCLPGYVCPPSALSLPNASTPGLMTACPPGFECPGTDHPLACPPGAYQPYSGETFCLACPPAFHCPTSGLLWPLPCPAGSVCPSPSTVNARLRPCDAGHVCPPATLHGDPRTPNASDTTASALAEARGGTRHSRRLLTTTASTLLDSLAALQLTLNGSATGAAVLALLYADVAGNGTVHLPTPCPLGLYCLPGTGQGVAAVQVTAAQLNSSLQAPTPCYPGYLCPTASITPLGSAPCPRSFYCPDSASAYPCPVGAYCPGGTLEPIPCPPSSYNNATAMAACSPCPLGHYCPVSGAFLPLPCPPGLVCDAPSLIAPSALCPAGHYCRAGTTTANASAPVTSRPHACPPAYYCLAGVVTRVSSAGNFTTPQLCTAGRYCGNATTSLLASPCPEGTYCPAGAVVPTVASVGYFVDYPAAPIEYQCLPGSFSPSQGSVSCVACPAGYSCAIVGAGSAAICPRGFYHSMADLICQACPRGTFSEVRGLPDASLCQPCLAGYVCGQEGLTGMDGATQCIEGYVCGEGTTPAGQYDYPCPPGFVCGEGTTPATQFDALCPAGYTCSAGVAASEATRSVCRKGYYCPPGVYSLGTGYTLAAQCVVALPQATMDDFGCGASNITVQRPYGDVYERPVGQCPEGTTSAISAHHLAECDIDPAWAYYPGPVWEFNPLSWDDIPAPGAGWDASAGCPYGSACPSYNDTLNEDYPSAYRSAALVQLVVGHMDYLVLTLQWQSISANMTYGVDYELLVYSGVVDTPGVQPVSLALPYGFTSLASVQRAEVRLGFMCLSNTTLTVSLAILNGLYLPQAAEFVDTGLVALVEPSRAVSGTRDVFVVVYDFVGRSLYQPINIPRLHTELPYSFMLEAISLDPSVPLLLDPSAEQITEDIQSEMDALGIGNFAFPYLPFFSNCRGYGSYLNMHVVFQDNASCTLVEPAEVVSVGNFDFLATPHSDTCDVQLQCLFEENMAEVTAFPRWFDKSADQNVLFYIAQTPFDASQWDEAPIATYADLANYYAPQLGSSSLVSVIVNRDQNAPSNAFPRLVELDISYQQTDADTKMIITGAVTLSNFSDDLTDTSYTLVLTLTPLTYFGLVNNFVFNETIFTIIYLIIGAITVVVLFVLWVLHRTTTRLHFPPAFRLVPYARIMFPPAIGAFILWSPFPMLVSYLLYMSFVVAPTPLFASISGNVASDLGAASFDTALVQSYAAGRIGICLLGLALYSMWAGARMFVPERRRKKWVPKQEKKKKTQPAADPVDDGEEGGGGQRRVVGAGESDAGAGRARRVLDAQDVEAVELRAGVAVHVAGAAGVDRVLVLQPLQPEPVVRDRGLQGGRGAHQLAAALHAAGGFADHAGAGGSGPRAVHDHHRCIQLRQLHHRLRRAGRGLEVHRARVEGRHRGLPPPQEPAGAQGVGAPHQKQGGGGGGAQGEGRAQADGRQAPRQGRGGGGGRRPRPQLPRDV